VALFLLRHDVECVRFICGQMHVHSVCYCL